MKLVTFASGRGPRPGALDDGTVVDLDALGVEFDGRPVRDVGEVLAADEPTRASVARAVGAAAERVRRSCDDVRLLPPVGRPNLVFSTSGSFGSHQAEMGDPPRAEVAGFIKSPTSLVGSGSPILLPAAHDSMVDWEGELAVVFGRRCHQVSPDEAMQHVAGFTILNDVSARDWVGRTKSSDPREAVAAWRSNLLFKQFPTFGPMGPAIVTIDEIEDVDGLELTTTINGEVVQHDAVRHMRISLAELIAETSAVHAFEAGDMITTGTPAGVGIAQDPPRFLRPGDVVEVAVPGVGTLSNPVLAGPSTIARSGR